MPYWLKLFLFILVADVVVFTLAHLLTEYGALFNVMLAVSAGYLAIRAIRWVGPGYLAEFPRFSFQRIVFSELRALFLSVKLPA